MEEVALNLDNLSKQSFYLILIHIYETSENFQILFGYSFGRLFALDILFNDIKLFSHYFIISASL